MATVPALEQHSREDSRSGNIVAVVGCVFTLFDAVLCPSSTSQEDDRPCFLPGSYAWIHWRAYELLPIYFFWLDIFTFWKIHWVRLGAVWMDWVLPYSDGCLRWGSSSIHHNNQCTINECSNHLLTNTMYSFFCWLFYRALHLNRVLIYSISLNNPSSHLIKHHHDMHHHHNILWKAKMITE